MLYNHMTTCVLDTMRMQHTELSLRSTLHQLTSQRLLEFQVSSHHHHQTSPGLKLSDEGILQAGFCICVHA